MEEYKRERSLLARTLAFYQFKRDFTTVNDYYWGAGSALQAVAGRVRHMTTSEDFRTELGLTQRTFDKPLGHSPARYSAKLSVSKRWHRLLTLVILTSAFERYLTAVATIAIASDPVLVPGFPKRVDGLVLDKYSLSMADRPTEFLTKGEWSARLATFRRYFHVVPTELQTNEGILETMRVKRNHVAHAFGLDTSSMSVRNAILLEARRSASSDDYAVSISEETLKKWFAVIDTSAEAIDSYLLPKFIGGYELAAICIEWNRDRDALYKTSGIKRYGKGSEARKLSKFLGALLEYPVQYEFAQSIMDYVDRL